MRKSKSLVLTAMLTCGIVLSSQVASFAAESSTQLSAERQTVLESYNESIESAEKVGEQKGAETKNVNADQKLTSDYVEPNYYTSSYKYYSVGGGYLKVSYTDNVPFDGKAHVASSDRSKSKSKQKDISIYASGSILNYATVSYKYKNNKKVAAEGSKKTPSITLKLKARKGVSKELKKAIKGANKKLKSDPILFNILPLDVTDLNPEVTWSGDKKHIKSVVVNYHGKKIKLGKKDYTIALNENDTYLLKFTNCYTGYFSNDIWLMPNYRTVSFETDCDKIVEPQRIKKGSLASKPTALEREKYKLTRWYQDEGKAIEFNFSKPVTEDITLYAGWKKYIPDVLTLTSDKNMTLTDSSSVTMYLTTDAEVDSIDLYKGDQKVASLLDDGKYNNSGSHADEIVGDGIYSCRVGDVDDSGDITFHAECGGVTSNGLTVKYIVPFTVKELNDMNSVNTKVDEFVSKASFATNTPAQNEAAAKTMLNDLVNSGLVKSNSIEVDDSGTIVTFEYRNGVDGGVPLVDPSAKVDGKYLNGIAEEISGSETLSNTEISDNEVDSEVCDNSAELDSTSDFVSGKALILNAFPAFEKEESAKDYRTKFYEDLKRKWDKKGLSTELITSDNVTVDEFKNIRNYDFVNVATHGSTYNGQPAVLLHEKVTKSKNEKYAAELKTGSIVQVGGSYWLLPDFFTNEFGEKELQSTLMFFECCQFLGHGYGSNKDNYNYSMSNAVLSRGCPALVGDHNSVFASYIRDLMASYVDSLMEGDTTGEAFKKATKKYGSNHKQWFENENKIEYKTWWTSKHPKETYDANEHIAYPLLLGDEDAELISKGLKNGDFELSYMTGSTIRPLDWNFEGDVRSVSKLGDIVPKNTSSKKMAVITTGIGSQSTKYLGSGGTEGSAIYQTVYIPENASKLSFDYNFVSEEPMEFVGSSFDDSFGFVLAQNGTNVETEILESINSSKWHKIGGVDFPGGDSTVYQTGWKSRNVDVSAYRGQILTMVFVVYDKGDSIYDSACLMDDVKLE